MCVGGLALEKEEVVSFIVAPGRQQAIGTDLMCILCMAWSMACIPTSVKLVLG